MLLVSRAHPGAEGPPLHGEDRERPSSSMDVDRHDDVQAWDACHRPSTETPVPLDLVVRSRRRAGNCDGPLVAADGHAGGRSRVFGVGSQRGRADHSSDLDTDGCVCVYCVGQRTLDGWMDGRKRKKKGKKLILRKKKKKKKD